MSHVQELVTCQTEGRGFYEITAAVNEVVHKSGLDIGLCVVFVQHTSASLTIQENADPTAQYDMEKFLERIAPEGDARYRHTAEGPDDSPAHLRAMLTDCSLTIPFSNGRLCLGTWQGIYLCEHRRSAHRRRVVVHLQGQGR